MQTTRSKPNTKIKCFHRHHILRVFLTLMLNNTTFIWKYVVSKCHENIGMTLASEITCICGLEIVSKETISSGHYFLYLPLKSQLKTLLEKKVL